MTRKVSAANLSPSQFIVFMNEEPTTGEALIHRVRSGYPAALVKQAAAFFNVPEKRLLQVIGVPVSTAHRYQIQNHPLDPAASERIHRMAILTRETIEILGDKNLARDWLLRPNLALGGVAPLDLLDTEMGANAVRRVLTSIAEGGVV